MKQQPQKSLDIAVTPTYLPRMETQSKSERFWGSVDRKDPNQCWNWTGRRTDHGYGRFRTGGKPRRTEIVAHRFAWTDTHGEIPPGMLVLHKCHNPACVNPNHLKLGSQKENVADMVDAGRCHKGKTRRRLTPNQIRAVWIAYFQGAGPAELSRQFNFSRHTARRILNQHTYKAIGVPPM